MSESSKSQRKEYISALAGLGIAATIYVASTGYEKFETRPRERCLASVFRDCAKSNSITIESGSVDHLDRQLINRFVSEGTQFPKVTHIEPRREPLLWLPDIIAWAYGRGGEWKKLVEPVIERVLIV
ncbi:MAG: hypothetical protein EBU89_05220 [Actinobacteria bacterium]|nr:hypothetical protein [Actinomycetota bacterium]NBO35305.1 hypothetical protein [Actinomycetota bacterium]